MPWTEHDRLVQKRRRYLANPDKARVPTDEVIQHIEHVLSQCDNVAVASLMHAAQGKISKHTLNDIYYGRRAYITNKTARAIFSIVPENVPNKGDKSHWCDPTLTQARLRRLLSHDGVTYTWLSQQTDVGRSVLAEIVSGRKKFVHVKTERKVREFTDKFIEQKVKQTSQ